MISRLTRLHPDTLLGKLVRLPLRLVPHGISLRVQAGLNKGKIWVTGVGDHGYWLGTYENDKQAITERLGALKDEFEDLI